MATVVNKRYREFVEEQARLRVWRQFYLECDGSFNIYPKHSSSAYQRRRDFVGGNET